MVKTRGSNGRFTGNVTVATDIVYYVKIVLFVLAIIPLLYYICIRKTYLVDIANYLHQELGCNCNCNGPNGVGDKKGYFS